MYKELLEGISTDLWL